LRSAQGSTLGMVPDAMALCIALLSLGGRMW
jgi:hypothetical protein